MSLMIICDECGKPSTTGIFLHTGRIHINGVDAGQWVDLCAEHMPPEGSVGSAEYQPRNCKRVSFYWPPAIPPQPTSP